MAAGKKVTSSDRNPVIGELEMITDGDKDASEGSFVELGPGLQQVTVDLGNLAVLYPDRKLEWDGVNLRITNFEAANEFVKPQFREGWSL